jgi:hypothetical protein
VIGDLILGFLLGLIAGSTIGLQAVLHLARGRGDRPVIRPGSPRRPDGSPFPRTPSGRVEAIVPEHVARIGGNARVLENIARCRAMGMGPGEQPR